jgi:hypothetical protein
VLVVALIVAVLIGNATTKPARELPTAVNAAAVDATGASSRAWFCPGFPTPVALPTQTLTVTNTGDATASIATTVYRDDGAPSAPRSFDVGAHAVTRFKRSDLGPAGGLVVEAFSRSILVEQGVESADQLAIGACATVAGSDWYFAAGTTGNFIAGTSGRPVDDWLVLFNPFGTDARVDVTLRTNEAVPETLESIDVPRQMRVLVPIHKHAVREPRVGVAVHATSGRVVASDSMIFGDQSGYTGVTLSLGATQPRPTWSFAYGSTAEGTRTFIGLVNTGDADTQVDVMVSAAATPVTAPLKRDQVLWVPIGHCGTPAPAGCVAVPDEKNYTVTVGTDADTPIVAEQLVLSNRDNGQGVATVMGTANPAPGGAFADAAVAADRHVVLAAANPGPAPITARLTVDRGGQAQRPAKLQKFTINPGQLVTINMSDLLGTQNGGLQVDATGPVVLTRVVVEENELSRAPAIAISR